MPGRCFSAAPRLSAVAALFAVLCSVWAGLCTAADAPRGLMFSARQRELLPDGTTPGTIHEKRFNWNPRQTAIVICDMWDQHWCQSATRRVGEMALRMNTVVNAAREQGVFVIHAPSSCMEFYKGTPQRQRAQSAPPAANPPHEIQNWCRRLEHEPGLPIDDSDGGCDCQPQCKTGNPWRRQIAAIEIAELDAISDSGSEIWNLLEARGLTNVLVMGVHTNMCVLGRPFGLRQMARNGKNVVLVRDLTDTMYNPRKSPQVDHHRGTDLVVAHIEGHVCPSILSGDICGEPGRPLALFVIGEDEYHTAETLPAFAKSELEPRGVKCRFVQVNPQDPHDFPGIEALREADLLVLSVRRRNLPAAQLAVVRDYLERGKPLVGIRTASHAFDPTPLGAAPPAGPAAGWPRFDIEVLGGDYQGHYSNRPVTGHETWVKPVADQARHPILAGLTGDQFFVTSHLYKNRDLAPTTTTLFEGGVRGEDVREPVAWTNNYRGGRIFYTSLGNPEDFSVPAFRILLRNSVFWAIERAVPSDATDVP